MILFSQGTQLLVEVCDEDPVGRDDLIDKLLININANSVMVGVETPAATYSGMFGFTTLSLSYSIQCVVNFQGQTCSDCVLGYMGSQCDVNIDDCAGVSCSAHGVCLDGINSFTCDCAVGFTGDLCSETVPIEGNVYYTFSGQKMLTTSYTYLHIKVDVINIVD